MRNTFGVALVLFTALLVAPLRADDAVSDKDRIAQLETQLKEALARIEKLEGEVEKLAKEPAKNDKPAKAEKTEPTKKVDESASFFPAGTKLTGTFVGSKAGTLALSGKVLSRSATGAVLRLTNSFATEDYDIRIKGSKVAIAGKRIVSTTNGGAPAVFTDIAVNGTIDADSIHMSGSWRVKGTGNGIAQVTFDVQTEK